MGDIDNLLRMPVLMLFLTLAVYALAVQIRVRTGNVLCNPVLISTLVLMGVFEGICHRLRAVSRCGAVY